MTDEKIPRIRTNSIREEVLNCHIVVGGSARSGTTALGRLIHSFANVEYFFEPAVISYLLTCENSLADRESWSTYERVVYDDLLLGSLAGRNLNLNLNDESCVYKAKPSDLIHRRLLKSHRKGDLVVDSLSHVAAYKVPAAVFRFDAIRWRYPNARIVGIHRGFYDVLNSLLMKRWFSDQSLAIDGNWDVAFRCIRDGIKIPHWVDDDLIEVWATLSEAERAARYYLAATNALHYAIENLGLVCVAYEEFICSPAAVSEMLLQRLSLAPGPMTSKVISSIEARRPPSKKLMFDLDATLLRIVRDLDAKVTDGLCSATSRQI